MRAAGKRFAGIPLSHAAPVAAAAALSFCALFFGSGFAIAPLVWIGGLTLLLAALAGAAVLLRVLPAPRVGAPAAIFLACLFGLAVWVGVTTTWSLSPDRTWTYTNLTLVYAGFALAGALVSPLVPRTAALAGAAAALLGLVLGWALLARCVPALYGDYGRVARLRAPVTYWNELALLCDVAVPLALWLAAPPGRRAAVRAAGVLLLFAATVTVLLTYSRVGVLLACVAAAAWVLVDRDRVESLVAVGLAGGTGAGVFALALSLPGITKDGSSHAQRVHDGWILGVALLGAGALVVAVALVLARVESRRPLAVARRARIERVAGIAAVALVLAGIGVSIAFAGRLWHEFANPVSSQIASDTSHLQSVNSSNRWRWWNEEWQAFTAHPGGGTGAGTFELTDRRLHRSPLVTTEPHNVPLQFLGETGIVGFLLYTGAAAAAVLAILRARRRASGGERAATTALGIGLAAFLAHQVVDVDWNYVATCGPLLLVAGALAVRGAPAAAEPARARRPLLALAGVLFACGAVYSLAAPWLAQRQLASATNAADVKRAHGWDPLSPDILTLWAVFEDASDPVHAEQLNREAVSLEPENADTWDALGAFYAEHGSWRLAYEAFSKAWTYDRYGVWAVPCGALDQARYKVFHVWSPNCPRGRPRATSP